MRGALGSGASGSSTIRARDFTPVGTPDHANGGDASPPAQVYVFGIGWPAANAEDVSDNIV
jgi:hypothetical protein